jgi:hypothetical protein
MPDALLTDNAETKPAAGGGDAPARPRAKRPAMVLINFWLDAALLVSIVFLGWVSAMMQVVFPPPTAADGWMLWGLSFNQWRDLQFGSLCVCGLLAIEHLVLHWSWVCGVIATRLMRGKPRPDQGIEAVYGVATLIGILTVMLAGVVAAILMVKQPPM